MTNLETTPTWNYVATLPSNYDLAFSGTTPYVSGPNSRLWARPNAIWRLDTSGTNQSTKIADVGGFAAGIAFDAAGNLYYGTRFRQRTTSSSNSPPSRSAQGGKTLSDATVLSNLPGWRHRRQRRGAGHVLFTVNKLNSQQLRPTRQHLRNMERHGRQGDNYSVIGTAGADHWYSSCGPRGDVTSRRHGLLERRRAWLARPGGDPPSLARRCQRRRPGERQ